MNFKIFMAGTVLMLTAFISPSRAFAEDPEKMIQSVANFVGNKLLKIAEGKLIGAVVDPIWDSVTGKPDLKMLESRLRELEANVAFRSELRDEVRKLRDGLTDRVTKDEFHKMVEKTQNDINVVQKRLDDLEQRVEKLEVENDDIKKGTKNVKNADFFLKRGEKYEMDKEIYKAVACYNIGIQIDPKSVDLRIKRCEYYSKLGVPAVGLADAVEIMRLDPKNAKAYCYRAMGRSQVGDFAGAIADFDEVKKGQVDSALDSGMKHWVAVAYSSRAAGRFVRIIDGWSDAQMADPKYKPDFDKVVDDLNKAIQFDSKYAEAYYYRSQCYMQGYGKTTEKDTDHYKKSLADLDEVVKLDPTNAYAYVKRGWCRIFAIPTEGVYGEAIDKKAAVIEYGKSVDDFTQAIKIGLPGIDWKIRRDVYMGRNSAYFRIGKRNESDKDREEAKKIVQEARERGWLK